MGSNTEGLKRSARSRSEGAMQRATAAILQMQSEEADINFRSVAARAKVSTAWLYRTKSVRGKIVKIRNTSPVAAGENLQHRQRLSHERVVATLRLRIRTLEDINRELKEQLEAAYGGLAVLQPKMRSCTERQNDALNTCDRCSEFRGT
jgi:cell division inhibitor SulA